MISKEFLSILACPETKETVHEADEALVHKINQNIAAGTLMNRGGAPVKEKIDAGLVRDDGKVLYPIRQDIPIMLKDEAIPLDSI